MAIYHLSVKPISRADGRSATAAAAYRAAEKIHDDFESLAFAAPALQGVTWAAREIRASAPGPRLPLVKTSF
jgi:hypothetical protein